MIRERLSNAIDQKGIFNTIKYVNRENDCVLLDTNIPYAHVEKENVNSYLSKYLFDFKNDFQTKVKNITQHDTVSYSKDDKITPEQAIEYAKELYSKTHNIENRNYVMAVHNDTDNLHVHIVWSNLDKNGKSYKVSNDYRIIEKEIDKIENKYKLIKPENRKATATKKPSPFDDKLTKKEKKRKDRGIVSLKDELKLQVRPMILISQSCSDFLDNMNSMSYIKIIINGENGAYSVKYKNEIFKASELGISKSKLEKIFGKDDEFIKKLKKYNYTSEDEECSLCGNLLYTKDNKYKKNTVLYTKFKHIEIENKVLFSFNKSNRTAFEYIKNENRISFHNTSRTSAKAGLQKWIAMNESSPILVTGNEDFRRNMWIEFKLMNLDNKGYSLAGFEPKKEDIELLEKIKSDYKHIKEKQKSIEIEEELFSQMSKHNRSIDPIIDNFKNDETKEIDKIKTDNEFKEEIEYKEETHDNDEEEPENEDDYEYDEYSLKKKTKHKI